MPQLQSKIKATEVILRPYLSERAYQLAQENKYVFVVHPNATKIDVRKAVEELFKVKVEKVWIVNLPPKMKKRKFSNVATLKRKRLKKAIVKLKEGYKLDIFEGEK